MNEHSPGKKYSSSWCEALADLLACVGPVLCKCPEQQSVFQAIAARQAQTVTDCRQEAVRPEPSSVATAAEALPAATGAHLAGDPEADRAVE